MLVPESEKIPFLAPLAPWPFLASGRHDPANGSGVAFFANARQGQQSQDCRCLGLACALPRPLSPIAMAAFSRRRGAAPEDADEDEEELLEWDAPSSRDTVLWLIDAGTEMHDTLMPIRTDEGRWRRQDAGSEQEEGNVHHVSLFHRAMQAVYHFERRKLVESPSDHCGVLLFNTRDDRFESFAKTVAYPHKILAQPLGQVAVPPVSELKDDLQGA